MYLGIRNKSAPVTMIDTGHPLLNTKDERGRIHAVLRHLGSGADLGDFPASASAKVALVKTANQRRLIVWHKGRGRYELTPAGWCELAPRRRFGAGSMMLGTTLGATMGAAVLAVFWFATGDAHGPAPRPVVASARAHVAAASAPAVTGSVRSASPAAQASTSPVPAAPAAPASPAPEITPAPAAVPVAAPVEAEPPKVAEGPTPEQLAEAAVKAKQAAAKKARQRAAAKRRREEAARAWAAAEPWRSREAEYSGHGVYGGYRGYGGQNSWYAYR
jgi:hypothetical protein